MSTKRAKKAMEYYFGKEEKEIPMMGMFLRVPLIEFDKTDLIRIIDHLEIERRKLEENIFSRPLR